MPVKILLVEDNPGDAELTRDQMARAKVLNELYVVEDGVEAIQFLDQTGPFADAPHPDLVLLDLNLPRKDGRDVLQYIKTHDTLHPIPVVVLTSSDDEHDIAQSYALNANAYVTKPVDLAGYKEIVHAIEDFWFGVVKLPITED